MRRQKMRVRNCSRSRNYLPSEADEVAGLVGDLVGFKLLIADQNSSIPVVMR